MQFQLPADLADPGVLQDLELSSVAGGQEHMPYPTDAQVEGDRLILRRDMNESGSIAAPWTIPGVGRFMTRSATLVERNLPYDLVLELARGKVNQLRCHAADWVQNGLLHPGALNKQIDRATKAFGAALAIPPGTESANGVTPAIQQAFQVANELVNAYTSRVYQLRHERQDQFDTGLGCRLEAPLSAGVEEVAFAPTFNTVSLAFGWRVIEPEPGVYCWKQADQLVDWAVARGLCLIGGPLIDFSGYNLPDWIWEKASDLSSLAEILSRFVETVVRRYGQRIRTWQVAAGANCSGILARRDEELVWLTLRLADAVKRINSQFEIIVGIAQPWGDYFASQERSKSPFIFADDLMRTGVKLAALELEFLMGISPRGSYCRDELELSRLLDLYALLGVPIQATLGYPSSANADNRADHDQRANLGWWGDGFSPANQAAWVKSFASLVLCKPYVRNLQWAHWSDATPHTYPNCGLIDTNGQAKPALAELQKLRAEHLK